LRRANNNPKHLPVLLGAKIMPELAALIDNELETMRRAPRKPAQLIPSEVSNGSVVAQLIKRALPSIKRALPSVIRDQKAHQKLVAANEQRRKADEALAQRGIQAATPAPRDSGEVFHYEQSDPIFV